MSTTGISHIEDLSVSKFMHVVSHLSTLSVTEKLDGSNLIVGIDSNGQLYTSRETKGNAQKHYTVDSYHNIPANNGFMAAHLALLTQESKLKTILNAGDVVEVEILFGRQPNAIVYGSNYIVFLRMLGDNPNKTKMMQLSDMMENITTNVTSNVIESPKGVNLVSTTTTTTWKFAPLPNLSPNMLILSTSIKELMYQLIAWDVKYPEHTFNTKKMYKNEVQTKFLLPIKELLLNQIVRPLQPKLRDVEVIPSEDIGIEGIVILDPITNEQTKIVDKTVFSVINQFNYAIRNRIKGRGVNTERYADIVKRFVAPVESTNATLYNNMLENIAVVIKVPQIGKYMSITKHIKKFKNVREFTDSWNNDEFSIIQAGIVNSISTGMDKLHTGLVQFRNNWETYVLELNDGREIRYTNETYKRTLVVFAETIHELKTMLSNVEQSITVGDIACAVFSKQIKNIQ